MGDHDKRSVPAATLVDHRCSSDPPKRAPRSLRARRTDRFDLLQSMRRDGRSTHPASHGAYGRPGAAIELDQRVAQRSAGAYQGPFDQIVVRGPTGGGRAGLAQEIDRLNAALAQTIRSSHSDRSSWPGAKAAYALVVGHLGRVVDAAGAPSVLERDRPVRDVPTRPVTVRRRPPESWPGPERIPTLPAHYSTAVRCRPFQPAASISNRRRSTGSTSSLVKRVVTNEVDVAAGSRLAHRRDECGGDAARERERKVSMPIVAGPCYVDSKLWSPQTAETRSVQRVPKSLPTARGSRYRVEHDQWPISIS